MLRIIDHMLLVHFTHHHLKNLQFIMDGVGEFATTSIWKENQIRLKIFQINFIHRLLYSAFTYYTGFKVNSGEYKMMGLSPYGKPK